MVVTSQTSVPRSTNVTSKYALRVVVTVQTHRSYSCRPTCMICGVAVMAAVNAKCSREATGERQNDRKSKMVKVSKM